MILSITSYHQTQQKSVKYPFNNTHLMSLTNLSRADVTVVGIATIIIVSTILITAVVHGPTEKSFSQIITVGPVWVTNSWDCTSDSEYIVHGVLISYEDPSYLTIDISGKGIQPDFEFPYLEMKSFSVGGPAGSIMVISTSGTITGYLTLQTMSDAEASCVSS